MGTDENRKEVGWLASRLWLVAVGLVVGLVLAGIYALKRRAYGGVAITIDTVIFIVVITVIACFVCVFLDRKRRRTPLDPSVSREQPQPSAWADLCVASYAKTSEFERWVPQDRAVGALPIAVSQILEDKTNNYHRVVVLMDGEIPGDRDATAFRNEIDRWCSAVLAPNRFRGLGAGLLLQTRSGAAPDMEFLLKLVDYRARNPATIQWAVWWSEAFKTAAGVHMPIEGKTTQCFVDLCVNLRNAGYSVTCRERPAEGILRFALAITRKTPWWLTVLGP